MLVNDELEFAVLQEGDKEIKILAGTFTPTIIRLRAENTTRKEVVFGSDSFSKGDWYTFSEGKDLDVHVYTHKYDGDAPYPVTVKDLLDL